MPTYRHLLRAAAMVLVLAAPPCRAADPGPVPDLATVVAPLIGSVVNITVLKPTPAKPGADGTAGTEAGRHQKSLGSGFIIDSDGLIVTNRHVLAGGYRVSVTLNDERVFRARVVSTNSYPDLALLKIDVGEPLPVVRWGDSEALRLGDTVIAIGNPLGLATSVTVGAVSAINRNVSSTVIDQFIQTDAPINRGNSGGPLFNRRGEVVGVNWAIVTPAGDGGSVGLGLAIPSDTARLVVRQMLQHGRLRAGFIGFALQSLTPDLARNLGLPGIDGGIINETAPDSPAARAGIHEGDVVVRIGARDKGDARAFMRELASHLPGSVVPVGVWRDGREWTVELPVEEFPEEFDPVGPPALIDLGPRITSPTLGLRVSPLDGPTRAAFGIMRPRPGVVVEGVAANSLGADLGLARGDQILRVNSENVPSAAALAAALARHRAGRGAVMQVVMQGRQLWIPVPPGDD